MKCRTLRWGVKRPNAIWESFNVAFVIITQLLVKNDCHLDEPGTIVYFVNFI